FSATMPPPIKKLADKFLNEPRQVEVARPATANVNIEQRLIEVPADRKREALRRVLRAVEVRNAIIFANRKTTVRELASSLQRSGFKAGQIHGDMEQPARIAELDRFKKDEINILVASDVAARGLDIKGVSHVVNFDVPWQPDDYIHRIGRTGRAGATGIAITLATRAEADQVAAIEKLTGLKIARHGHDGETDSRPAAPPESRSEPRKDKDHARRAAKEPPKRSQSPKPEKAKREDKPRPEPSLVVEDLAPEWNGPLPSFLSKGAG
ncbi:MAG TPA: DEAD/DEAH box helicase, partial [Sphingomicrobium sp.]|nr:DEAD/DEAH box helicase [Sphingomicrobium sp.]